MVNKNINILIILVLVLMLGRFVTQTYARMLTNSNSAEGDQQAFLQLGLELPEKGTLTDGTRNPLYAAFLATIAQRDWSYFTQAKLLSMMFGILAIVALYILTRRSFNLFTGLTAAWLLSINTEFIVHSATALTESLLTLLFILAWFAMITALNSKDKPLYWAMAGGVTGFAYLAKGSTQLMVLAFFISAFLIYRFKIFQAKGLWLFLASYGLVASPLWIYNTIQFGHPTFNYAITHQMWMERWTDWHPDAVDNLPTAFSYLRTHTISEIINREWAGMKALRNILIKTLWPTRTLKVDRFLLSNISGYTLALLAVLPLIFWNSSRRYLRENRSAVYLTGLTVVLFFLSFAWYVQIVALGQRFLLPIIPFIFILAAHILGRLWQKISAQGFWIKRGLILISAVLVFYQGYWAIRTNVEAVHTFLTRNVFEQDRQFNTDSATPLVWLVRGATEPVGVAWGPSGKSLPVWAYSDRLRVERYPPNVDTIPELTRNLTERGLDFVIVAPDMVSRYRTLLAEQFPSDGTRIEVAAIPKGWALSYAYRDMPCDWCVFRLLESNPPRQQVDYQLGQGIRLVGYDLVLAQSQAGTTVHLTLHWQAKAPTELDYTVFTQLLGPDFQLHGQVDRQPINNLWPTSRWQPGDRLADRYDISLSNDVPPGQYQILVGMYNLQTGQRLPVTRNGEPVSDNAIYLTSINLPTADIP